MSISVARQDAKCVAVSATITRANGDIERLGTIAYWHRNPIKRGFWNFWIVLKGKARGFTRPK